MEGLAKHGCFVYLQTAEGLMTVAQLNSRIQGDAPSAPVSGGVIGAEAGTLTFMVGGSAEAFARGNRWPHLPRADQMDIRLHAERRSPCARLKDWRNLPDGVMVAEDGNAFLGFAGRLFAWSAAGYLSELTAHGIVATAFALPAAFLNAAFGFCLGREVYGLLTVSYNHLTLPTIDSV